jgi:hypothetical protein
MTGRQHFAAEQLLEHAATLLEADVEPERASELVQRQIAVAPHGRARALLAVAATYNEGTATQSFKIVVSPGRRS